MAIFQHQMSADQQAKKLKVAAAAIEQLRDGLVLGVGTGSTVNAFIDLLEPWAPRLKGAVSSSEASSQRLGRLGIPLLDLNAIDALELYIDGADEATRDLHLIKGGGAALTREKIVAAAAQRFVCIVDESKVVERLGRFPLPVEVIPLARGWVARQIAAFGGRPVWREGVVTDNGNHILDVHGLAIADPVGLEAQLNQIVGVVTVGLFAARPADLLLVATDTEVRRIERAG
jgi:ribose 5-phosphate isomerase A